MAGGLDRGAASRRGIRPASDRRWRSQWRTFILLVCLMLQSMPARRVLSSGDAHDYIMAPECTHPAAVMYAMDDIRRGPSHYTEPNPGRRYLMSLPTIPTGVRPCSQLTLDRVHGTCTQCVLAEPRCDHVDGRFDATRGYPGEGPRGMGGSITNTRPRRFQPVQSSDDSDEETEIDLTCNENTIYLSREAGEPGYQSYSDHDFNDSNDSMGDIDPGTDGLMVGEEGEGDESGGTTLTDEASGDVDRDGDGDLESDSNDDTETTRHGVASRRSSLLVTCSEATL